MSDQLETNRPKHARIFDILHQTSRSEAQENQTSTIERPLESSVADALIAQAKASLRPLPTKTPGAPFTAHRVPRPEEGFGLKRTLRRSSPL